MVSRCPFESLESLLSTAETVWSNCSHQDWREAFSAHPRIGDMEALKKKFHGSGFEAGEQSGANNADESTLQELARGNEQYEEKFGHIFLICATGKSANEMLEALLARMNNDAETEIRIAMGEQAKITELRLLKLLVSEETVTVNSKL